MTTGLQGGRHAPRDAARLLACLCALSAALDGARAQSAPPGTADAPTQLPGGPIQTAPGTAHTAAAQAGGVEDVIVTASKRSERLQRVPVSVTVVSGGQLKRQNINNVDDLSRAVPSLTNTQGPAGALSIRGIGTQSFARTAEASVGVVIDNVAIANATAAQAPLALYDIARVEVLEGPQGTLFGRESSAGVLNLTTNAPVIGKYEVTAHADFGSRDGDMLQTAENFPLGDNAALRISDHLTREPETIYAGYRHEWDQDDDEGARARLLWQVRDDLTLNLIADYDSTHTRNDTWAVSNDTPGGFLAGQLARCGVVASSGNHSTCLDGPVSTEFQAYGVSGQADYQLGDLTLTSITAARWLISGPVNLDSDSIPLNYLDTNYGHEHLNNVSQELRVTSPAADRLSYVAGLYFFNSAQAYDGGQSGTLGVPILELLKATAGQDFTTNANSRSLAGFGQATYRLSERARLILGGRLDNEDVHADTLRTLAPGALANFATLAPVHGRVTDTDFSYRGGLQYDLAPDVMAYATYTRGYKGPAVNDQTNDLSAPIIVRPEIPHDVELGVKANLLQRRLALNVSLFHDKIDEFQTTIFDPRIIGYVFGNAPELTTQGVEISAFGSPLPGLTFNGGATYSSATYGAGYYVPCGPVETTAQGCVTTVTNGQASSQTDVQGRQLIGAPRWRVTLSGEYDHRLNDRLTGFVQMDAVFTSAVNYNAAPDPLDGTGAHFVLGERAGVRTADGRYGIALFVRNLTDDRDPAFVIDTPLAAQLHDLNSHAQYFGPDSFRTFGISLDVKF